MRKEGSVLIGAILLMVGLLAVSIGISSAVLSTTIKTKRAYDSTSAISFAEGGAQKALWELNKSGSTYTGELNNLSLSGGSFDVTVTTINSTTKQITATGYVPTKTNYRSKKVVRVKISDKPSSTGVAFSYGVQAGALGITMSNNAKIIGNVYAQGTISGSNNASVTGDVIMSGASGSIQNLSVSGNAKAHTITGSSITKDAWYQTLTSTTVGGTKHPSSPDPANVNLPISNQTITDWEQVAVAGGTYEGNMTLSGTSSTLGPKKINGNLTVTNNATVTIAGTVWVTGNISFSNDAIVKLSPGYGTTSGLIIADSPTNKLSYGKINVGNNVQIQGSGSANSYIMLLSTNSGGISSPAINISNNSAAVVYYATTGFLEVSNNANLRAITGGGLHLSNGSQVQYDSGLASTEFSGGPGGAWTIIEWQVLY